MSIPAHYVVYTPDEFDVWQDTGIRGDTEDEARQAWLGDPARVGMAFDIRLEPCGKAPCFTLEQLVAEAAKRSCVLARFAVFSRYAGEKLEPPGPWSDTGIRAGSAEQALAKWAAGPTDWADSELRLVLHGDVPAVEPDPSLPVERGYVPFEDREPSPEVLAARRSTIAKWKAGITPLVRGDQ